MEYNGRPMFKTSFLDFMTLASRDYTKKSKYEIDSEPLLAHLSKTRYSKEYVVECSGMMVMPYRINNGKQ